MNSDLSRKHANVSKSNICGGEIQHVVAVAKFWPYLESWSHFNCCLWQWVSCCRNVTTLLKTEEIQRWSIGRDRPANFLELHLIQGLTLWLQLMRACPPPYKQHLYMDFPLRQCRNATPSLSAHLDLIKIWFREYIYLPWVPLALLIFTSLSGQRYGNLS